MSQATPVADTISRASAISCELVVAVLWLIIDEVMGLQMMTTQLANPKKVG